LGNQYLRQINLLWTNRDPLGVLQTPVLVPLLVAPFCAAPVLHNRRAASNSCSRARWDQSVVNYTDSRAHN